MKNGKHLNAITISLVFYIHRSIYLHIYNIYTPIYVQHSNMLQIYSYILDVLHTAGVKGAGIFLESSVVVEIPIYFYLPLFFFSPFFFFFLQYTYKYISVAFYISKKKKLFSHLQIQFKQFINIIKYPFLFLLFFFSPDLSFGLIYKKKK